MTLRSRSANIVGTLITANGISQSGINITNQIDAAYAQANAAYSQANAAYTAANNAQVTVYANSNSNVTTQRVNFVNTSTITVAVTNDNGNANVAFTAVGGAAFDQANAAYAQANIARDTANAAYAQANTARSDANTTFNTINLAFSNTNTVFGTVNTAITNAHNQANAAYAAANLKLNISGGTINGSLNVSGNLTITGNTTYQNVTTYIIDDPLIYLAANNDLSDLVDIGFIGGHNTAGVYQHSGLARDAGDGTWYLFTGLAEEGHINNVIDFANTTLATLRANINANSILLTGNAVATQANLTLSYNQANAAYTQANNARSDANTTFATLNTSANTQNTWIANLNTATGTINSHLGTINTTFGTVNTTLSTLNTTFATLNTADSNRVLKAGDTMTGQLNISSGGLLVTGSIVGSQSISIGNGGGTYQAGSLYSDSNWGMLFRAAQSSPAVAHFSWRTSADGELMRMDASGNLGINMTPGRRFDVNGGGRFVQDTAATTGAITLRQNSGDTVPAYIQWVNNAANSERGWMTMDTSSNFILATASAEKLRVTSGGNVGVGTSSPATKLHVAGSTRIDHAVGGSSLENGNGLQINGAYTNGQYSHRFRKWDDGGGVPLYVQFTEGTANTWSNLAKFGPNSADSSSLTVYGTARAYRASGDNMGVLILGGDANNSYLRVQNSTASIDYGQGNGTAFVNVNNNQGWYVATGGSSRLEITGAGAVNIRGTSFANDVIFGNNSMGALDTASNMNTLNQKSGFYFYNNPTNGPFGTWTTWLQTTGHYLTDNYGWQLAKNYFSNDWRIRGVTNNTWGSWLGLVLYGNNTSAGDVYATRFYDANDTNVFFDGGELVLRSIAPTIYFRDTDHFSAMLHCNSSLLYVLRGANDTTSFTQVNGQWPFIFYLGDNNALCGGSFSAVGNVTAYSSDRRLKTNIKNIPNALDKVLSLNGVTFDWIDRVKELGFTPDTMINDAGIIAQEVQEVLPQAVKPAPFDYQWDENKNDYASRSGEDFITVQYEKLVPLLIEAIKELKAEIDLLKQRG